MGRNILAFPGKPGRPVPEVDPQDLQTAHDIFSCAAKSRPGGNVGVSIQIFQHACKPGADIPSVTYRAMLIGFLLPIAKEQLQPWMKEGQLDAAVFREFARLPMKWMGTGAQQQGFPFDAEALFQRLQDEAG